MHGRATKGTGHATAGTGHANLLEKGGVG